jgi:hypothetical protein
MIVGLRFNKILVEKDTSKDKAKISKIETKTDIINVEEEKIDMNDKKALKFNFLFNAIYHPEISKLTFEGSVLFLESPDQVDKILDSWKKKDLPVEIRVDILNTIFNKCNLKALELEQDFNLPPHFPLPKFSTKDKENPNEAKTNYAG